MDRIFPDGTANFNVPGQQWIAEKAILASKNNSIDQINAISSQIPLHGESTFYPMLTVQLILEIPPYIPWNS